jgi:hypothetical protein
MIDIEVLKSLNPYKIILFGSYDYSTPTLEYTESFVLLKEIK